MTQISSDFHGVLKDAAKHTRQRLAEADVGSHFYLEVKVSGRIQEGEVKLAYSLKNDIYSDNSVEVTGNSLDVVIAEFLRRIGWQERHAPLALESPKATETEIELDDKVPY